MQLFSINIELFYSARDRAGNCYWAFTATDPDTGKQVSGKISGGESNISMAEFFIRDRWPYSNETRWRRTITELPIRKWNNLTADFGYAGCDPKEILRYIQKGLEAETPQQRQVKFVSELCDAIKAEVGARIVKGDLPPEWDGHELRVLLARKFQESAEMSVILKYPRNKRAKDFKNHMLVNNI